MREVTGIYHGVFREADPHSLHIEKQMENYSETQLGCTYCKTLGS